MMPIVFRRKAADDLKQIISWYERVAPQSVERILADIYRSIDQLTAYPESGMRVAGRNFRRIVTHKYHFKISYMVEADFVAILGIYRYQNREV